MYGGTSVEVAKCLTGLGEVIESGNAYSFFRKISQPNSRFILEKENSTRLK